MKECLYGRFHQAMQTRNVIIILLYCDSYSLNLNV